MTYCRRCGTKLPVDATYCPKCGTLVEPAKNLPSLDNRRTFAVTGKPQVTVTNRAPGAIRVETGKNGEVVIDPKLRNVEDLDWSISQTGNAITASFNFRTGYFWRWLSRGPHADISVTVPETADIDLRNRFDKISVTGVKGTVSAISSIGGVSIRNCEGVIKVSTKTGSIDLEEVKGISLVRASTGSIKFIGALSGDESSFRTSTGNIELTLHGKLDVRMEASTRLGHITTTPTIPGARYEKGWFAAQLGTGTRKLFAETKTGNITIRQQPG